jgi:hypothetical protein
MHFCTFHNVEANLRLTLRSQKIGRESSRVAAYKLFSFSYLHRDCLQLCFNTFQYDELCIAGRICDGMI